MEQSRIIGVEEASVSLHFWNAPLITLFLYVHVEDLSAIVVPLSLN